MEPPLAPGGESSSKWGPRGSCLVREQALENSVWQPGDESRKLPFRSVLWWESIVRTWSMKPAPHTVEPQFYPPHWKNPTHEADGTPSSVQEGADEGATGVGGGSAWPLWALQGPG